MTQRRRLLSKVEGDVWGRCGRESESWCSDQGIPHVKRRKIKDPDGGVFKNRGEGGGGGRVIPINIHRMRISVQWSKRKK